jgi:hypothetical protein
VQGVVVVVAVLTPLLQLLVSTAVFTTIGLGMNKFKDPPTSMLFSTLSRTVNVTLCSKTLYELACIRMFEASMVAYFDVNLATVPMATSEASVALKNDFT